MDVSKCKGTSSQDPLFTREKAAEHLGVQAGTLAVWACNKRYGLPVVKVGRLVKYRLSDLEAFIERRTINKDKGDSYGR